jgi:hypothetical protein
VETKLPLVLIVVSFATATGRPCAQEAERRLDIFDVRTLLMAPDLGGRFLPAPPALRMDQRDRLPESENLDRVVSFVRDDPEETARNRPSGGVWISDAELQRLVQRLIAPRSWSGSRDEFRLAGGSLAVLQTPDVLSEVEGLLTELEARTLRSVLVELALVPPAAMDSAAPGWSRLGASPWLDGGVFDRALTAAGAGTAYLSTRSPPGLWKRLGPDRISVHVLDHGLEPAASRAVISPFVHPLPLGEFAEVLVLPSPDGTWHRVDLRCGASRLIRAPRAQRLELGDVELLDLRDAHLGTSLIAPAGKTVVAGVWMAGAEPAASAGADRAPPFVALLRVGELRQGEGVERRRAATAVPPSAIDVGILSAPPRAFPLPSEAKRDDPRVRIEPSEPMEPMESQDPSESFSDRDGDEPPDAIETVAGAAIREAAGREHPHVRARGSLVLAAPAEVVAAVKQRLEVQARESATLITLDLVQLSLDAGEAAALGSPGSFIETAQVEEAARRADFRCRAGGLSGVEHSLAAVASRGSVHAVEYFSGGTGDSVDTVGDPIVRSAGEGFVLNARAEGMPGTASIRLRLSGEVARPPRFGHAVELRRKLRAEPDSGEKAGDGAPETHAERIELPEEDSDRIDFLVTLPQGKPLVLSAVPDGTQPGRTRLLVATASAFSLAE